MEALRQTRKRARGEPRAHAVRRMGRREQTAMEARG